MEQHRNLADISEEIGYRFSNETLLKTALTHSSYQDDVKEQIQNNERLEFLGDSVLNLSISEYIYKAYPDLPVGKLTRIRAGVVSEPSLSKAAQRISLGEYLILGKAANLSGGRKLDSILADAFEAVIGAIYLDGGFKDAQEFVLRQLLSHIDSTVKGQTYRDFKTELQEYFQKETDEKLQYTVISEEGPDHNKTFHVQVSIGKSVLAKGSGKSKKEAEQLAAQKAFEKYVK
ncbi:MAG: ribonuclease III [Clostridia bacterium]|jgi:ribonuclease-3